MKKKAQVFSVSCVLILFAFVVFMVWYTVSMSSLDSKIAETRQSLETSRGRENKQQAEYDKAVAELPLVQAELQEKQPLAEEAESKVAALKTRRKELRAEKQELEEMLSGSDETQEDGSHE